MYESIGRLPRRSCEFGGGYMRGRWRGKRLGFSAREMGERKENGIQLLTG